MTKILVQALILSKLDYCNSLLLGIPKYNMAKLQRIQNMSCRMIYQLPKYSTISTYLAKLHWLKIQESIVYKVATIMFKCINNIAPAYLSELVISQPPHSRGLRSSNKGTLYTTRSRTEFVHRGSFKSMGQQIWNNLPTNIKNSQNIDTFKTRLKTHLFRISHHST